MRPHTPLIQLAGAISGGVYSFDELVEASKYLAALLRAWPSTSTEGWSKSTGIPWVGLGTEDGEDAA